MISSAMEGIQGIRINICMCWNAHKSKLIFLGVVGLLCFFFFLI